MMSIQGALPPVPGKAGFLRRSAVVRPLAAALLAGTALGWSTLALAQTEDELPRFQPRQPLQPGVSDAPVPANPDEIGFVADNVQYEDKADVVTATGNVQLVRDGNRLRADKIVWDRKSGKVEAFGNVVAVDPEGNVVYGDKLDVTDTLKDGVTENMLIVMRQGSRIAARQGQRTDGVYYLDTVSYTGCNIEDSDGCPKNPAWKITADKVIYNPDRERVNFKNARMELFGVPIIGAPSFSTSTGNGGSGFLTPIYRIGSVNGYELAVPYYWKIASNRDLTIIPHIYTGGVPMLEATYRSYTSAGGYRLSGFVSHSKRVDSSGKSSPSAMIRGYVDASGAFQLSPNWSIDGSIRRATDRTFTRRYYVNWDTRLRSLLRVQRIDDRSYFSLAGWSVQTLRSADRQGLMPLALPVADWRLRLNDPLLGGRILLQANTLAIARSSGQDTQRAFVGAEWNLRRLTTLGQEISLTAYARGDVYHSRQNYLNPQVSFRGRSGWQTRGIVALAGDMRWPFAGPAFGGTQRITPRVQIVAAPKLSNLLIPNEDSQTIELEDSNLFALNRFSGYDRFEDSSRITYGIEYSLTLPDFTIDSVVGQSYRLNRRATLLPNGTGLASRLSDVVGRTTVRYKDFVNLTHRFRIDKDNYSIRRNEVDLTLGSYQTYVTVGYQRLNRNINAGLSTLRDHEEVRVGARVQIARYWSIFGSAVIDMTNKHEDPASTYDGFEPVRQRAGISYSDECLDISFVWRRNYNTVGDAKATDSYQLRLAFRNLGI